MLKVGDARNIILENTTALGSETIDILSALNRILSEDIYAAEDIPTFNNSAMDGYAVVFSSLRGAAVEEPKLLKVIGNLPAGQVSSQHIDEDTTVKIMTGAPMPHGADAVIPVEYTELEGDYVKINREVSKWENFRFKGEDVKKDQLIIPKGKLLRPAEIGMLAALNIPRVSVSRKPRVSILTTGDELVDLGEELAPGKVRNINSYSLYAEVLDHGAVPLALGTAKDNQAAIKEKLMMACSSDILLVSAGVSAGDYDYVKSVLIDLEMKERFWKVAVKPGKPVLFGIIGNTLVFGLPGNPVSSIVAFRQFVLPAIYKMQGRTQRPWKELYAVLEGELKKDPGLTHFIRGKTFLKDGKLHVRSTGHQSSGIFHSMVLADCLITLPESTTEVKDGEEVFIQITDWKGD